MASGGVGERTAAPVSRMPVSPPHLNCLRLWHGAHKSFVLEGVCC